MTELQQAAQQALKILDSEFTTLNGEFCRWCDGRLNAKHNCALEQTITALRAALAEPVACEPQYANDDGWCDWVCPKPMGYLMQCCGCGLIHEVESRVAKYQPRPSEEFKVVDDPDLQVQWRMKRRDDISPQPAQQIPPEAQTEAEKVAYCAGWWAAMHIRARRTK